MNTIERLPEVTENEPEGEEVKETSPEEETDEVAAVEEEETETPSETSPEEKPEEEPAPEKESPSEEKEITGLSEQREKLLAEIRELRKERREVREKQEEGISPPVVLPKKEEELGDVADSDVALIEKVLKAKGYVRKEELQATTYNEVIENEKNSFLERHPEYKPENDTDDKLWNALKHELYTYYKKPDNPRDMGKVLEKIHSALNHGTLPTKSSATSRASAERIKTVSKSGSGRAAEGSPKVQTVEGVTRSMFSGFTEDELKELGVK